MLRKLALVFPSCQIGPHQWCLLAESGTNGYRLYDPVAKKLHISRDVIFEENRAWRWNEEVPNIIYCSYVV